MHNPRDYEIRIRWSGVAGDECYIAQVVEWPTIMAHGETREAAAREIQLALEGALEVAHEAPRVPPADTPLHAKRSFARKGVPKQSLGTRRVGKRERQGI